MSIPRKAEVGDMIKVRYTDVTIEMEVAGSVGWVVEECIPGWCGVFCKIVNFISGDVRYHCPLRHEEIEVIKRAE